MGKIGYIIPTCGRETIREIGREIYNSEFCRYSRTDIATALFAACIQNKSLEAVAKAPNADTVIWRINKGITFDGIKRLIVIQRPEKGAHLTILLDGHDDISHGKRDTVGLVGTKPKNGSSYAFKYLVAYTTSEPHSIVDVMPLFDGSTARPTILMIEELRKDYVIDGVIMDGEFYLAELLEYLFVNDILFTCRRTDTGNIKELDISYRESMLYNVQMDREGRVIGFKYWLYRYKGKDGDFYLASSIHTTPGKLRKLYKIRWNIETCFREVNIVKMKTKTMNFLVRLFFYVVASIVYNLWMKVRLRFSLLELRMYEFTKILKDFVKENMMNHTDIGNTVRKKFIRLLFW